MADKLLSEPATSATLLRRVAARDQDAWSRLVFLYTPLVEAWCRRASLQPSDAADVTQEVFLTVSGKVGEFRHERAGDTFRGWLYTITFHKVGDHLRRGRHAVAEGGSDAWQRLEAMPENLPAEDTDSADSGLVHRALDLIRPEFGERAWQMFWRSTAGGEATAAIAVDLGVTPDAVRMAKARVLRRCREELEGLADL